MDLPNTVTLQMQKIKIEKDFNIPGQVSQICWESPDLGNHLPVS